MLVVSTFGMVMVFTENMLNAHTKNIKLHTKFCDETPKRGVHFRNLGVNRRIILN